MSVAKWLFPKLNSQFPLRPCSFPLISTFKTSTFPNPFSNASIPSTINVIEISRLLSTCGREGNLRVGSCLHAYIIKNPPFFDLRNTHNNRNVFVVYNSLLSMYCKCGELHDAVKLFDRMPLKDTVSWNSIISGFLKNGALESGFGCFKSMFDSGVYQFDHASLTTILSPCDGIDFLGTMKMIHGLVISNGYENEITVLNALITAYFRCKCFDSGRGVFDEMVERNVITWTAAISGLAQNEFYEESLKLFAEMQFELVVPNYLTYLSVLLACSGLQALKEGRQIHGIAWKSGIQSDLCIESALMDMYSKCGSVEDAWRIFESAEVLDEVSMTVILVGFVQNGLEDEAIQMFTRMVKEGSKIDPSMISAILGVDGIDTSLAFGKQVHALVIKKGYASNVFVSNGLINMYSKCGELEESVKIFYQIPQKNQVSWNSMIAAFARHGDGFKSLKLYEEMKSEGVEPTDVTFLSLLHACSHVGLVQKGMKFFELMVKDYGMRPRMEHYACLTDMIGRAGLINEAKNFIAGLSVKPDVLVWQALLGAASIRGDIETAKYAADQLARDAPDSPVPYISMANIYSSQGHWRERARTIKKMKEKGVKKETGISWIEIDKKIHSFVVADQMHPQGYNIYGILSELLRHMRDEGYVPDRRLIFVSSDHDESGDSIELQNSCTYQIDCRNEQLQNDALENDADCKVAMTA
ncbi:Pentatricopeptide repeat-containing protein [Forsythia ovata]|uniref:Pentatricopeptide repeat-containing protein n=1 Tax=Forsythia ovata TaxID=205694 RepID=A0ABD1TQ53_9LAMI